MITIEDILMIINGVCPKVDTESIKPNVLLREYGIDSLDYFDILLQLQERLGKEIPDEDVDQLRTVASIREYCERHGA